MLRAARSHPYATASEIAAVVRCHPSTVRKHLQAAKPGRSRRHSHKQLRVHAAHGLAGDTLLRLARAGDAELRRSVARNPNAPPPALERLARDPIMGVRWWAGQHDAITPRALVVLAADPDPGHRRMVVEHPVCPQRLLARLAGDPNRGVRIEVAQHPATPPAVLEQLSRSNDPALSRSAEATLRRQRRGGRRQQAA